MIYLVSRNKNLFNPEAYTQLSFFDAIKVLEPLNLVQLDTETMGLDCHTKALLTIQLGNKDNQIVFDWTTLSKEEKEQLKILLEDPNKTYLAWNISFDLTFLYVQGIYPKNILDGMIIDKLIFLGYPPVLASNQYDGQFGYKHETDAKGYDYWELSYSLKAAAERWCNISIDKSVRGQIIDKGLTEDVVVYAANDVKYLEDIYNAQMVEVKKQNLEKAVKFECEAVKSVAYTKYCGIHMDAAKWKAKMKRDSDNLNQAISDLNQYVLDLYKQDSKLYKPFVKWVDKDLFGFVDEGYNCIINWSSSKQVIPLFNILGIKTKTFDKKTRKEKESIEANILSPQAKDFPIISLFLKYQGASKLVSTYGENWLKAINPKTGRIHVEIYSIGTDTARMSSGGGVWKLNLLILEA